MLPPSFIPSTSIRSFGIRQILPRQALISSISGFRTKMTSSLPKTSALVTPQALQQNLSSTTVLDATWYMPNVSTDPRKEYDIEHIPGARFFDIDSPSLSDATNPLPHMLPPADLFASSVQELGVREGKPLVIYARKGFVAAARAWWMFRVFGKDDVFVLDGGLTSWKEAGYETASRVEAMSATEIPGKPLTPVFRKDFVKDMDEILQQIRDKQGVIIDARAADRFFSRVPEPRKELRSGHMPGALSVPATTLVDANGRLKSLDDINDILEKAGFQHAGQGPVSLSCGSGVTAAIVCLALHQVGVTNAAVYDGSWTEYGAHDNPVVSG